MPLARLHRSLDAFAMWSEDLVRRPPELCRLAPAAPLDCFGPLPALPAGVPEGRRWSVPSPRPLAPDDRLSVRTTPAMGPRRGTALLVPPWKIRSAQVVNGWATLLARCGWETWLVSPPHHLERTVAGARSGEGFVSLDLARTRAVFEQLVLELRVCAALASRQGPVGVAGLSLGALAAGLAATAPEPLAFAALLAPPSLTTVLLETGIGRRYRRLAEASGTGGWPGNDAVAAALAPFEASRRSSTARHLFIAAGRYDAIVQAAPPHALARAWGVEPHLYPRGHLSLLFLCRAVRQDLAAFLASAS